jgi:hypothetical protein
VRIGPPVAEDRFGQNYRSNPRLTGGGRER